MVALGSVLHKWAISAVARGYWGSNHEQYIKHRNLSSVRIPLSTAATILELRSQAQVVITGNLTNLPCLYASTVSDPCCTRSFVSGGLLQVSNAQDNEECYKENSVR